MAIENKRACGFRKVGGIYFVGGIDGMDCHRLPFNLGVCPCCNAGIKYTRGFTWITPKLLFGDCDQAEAECHGPTGHQCKVCAPPEGKHGLLWIGKSFYKTAEVFMKEAREFGVSRRIQAVPRNFKLGETWIYLAHIEAGLVEIPSVPSQQYQMEGLEENQEPAPKQYHAAPAIFYAFKPTAIEKIITEEMATADELEKLNKQNITPVIVPDWDMDHQGNVHNDKSNAEKE